MGNLPTRDEIIGQGFRKIEQDLAAIQANMVKTVDHVNGWVAKIDGIDNVAFALMYMQVNGLDKFQLSKPGIKKTQAAIDELVLEMNSWRERLQAEAEAKAKKEKPNANKTLLLK